MAAEGARFLGVDLTAFAGDARQLWQFVHPADESLIVDALGACYAGHAARVEFRVRAAGAPPSDNPPWIRLIVVPIAARSNNKRRSFLGCAEDITGRKEREALLRASERQFRQLAENIDEMFWVSEVAPRRILYVSQGYTEIWGRPVEELYADANSFLEGIHPDDRPRIEQALPKARQGGYEEIYRVVHPDGSVRTVRARAFPVRNEEGEVYRVAGIIEDITLKKHAEEEMLAQRRFLEHLLQVQEGERKLVAYDIHDGFVQSVIAAVMHLDALQSDRGVRPQTLKKLAAPVKLLRDSIEEARRMISGLRPPILDEQGLVAAIEYLINERSAQGTRITFEHAADVERLDSVVEGSLFRIVQEALSNIYRHSQAAEASIKLSSQGDRLQVVIEDAGVGFDPANVSGRQFGLRGMRERANLLGGTAVIRSTPGQGTRIEIDIPARPTFEGVG
ncbi:MAG TPA: PAS domain-containing protein [Pirellulales bacterium]|nr:PAS domain-containing protein [Pirellulales bacterium]